MAFPTISKKPIMPLDFTREDSVLRSETDGGYVMTRPRFTRSRAIITVGYESLPDAEAYAIDDFYVIDCANGSAIFQWTHPTRNTVYNVRFKEPVKISHTSYGYCDVQFTLEQA